MILKFKASILFIIPFYFGLIDAQIIHNQKCGIPPEESNHSRNWGYGYNDLLDDIEIWQQSQYVNIDSIGRTVQGRAIWELTISEDPSSITHKRIYIHARTHPGEEEAFWVTDEIINFLLADTPEASFIRSNTIFHIVPMHNPDGVELGYSRENANGLDIESGWDDNVLEPEVSVLQNRFLELSFAIPNPIQVALNMHSAYACKRYFVYHHENGTSSYFTDLEKDFISGIQHYYPNGIEDWNYFVSWSSNTPDQYPESWWWFNYAENVMALTYEDMNCSDAGNYNITAEAIVRGVCDYLGINLAGINDQKEIPSAYALKQNYPNPFNPLTTIDVQLTQSGGNIRLSIVDISGNEIKVLANNYIPAGVKSFQWDSKDRNGKPVPSGVYFYHLETSSFKTSKKMILIK